MSNKQYSFPKFKVDGDNLTPLVQKLFLRALELQKGRIHTYLGICDIKTALDEILQKHPGILNY